MSKQAYRVLVLTDHHAHSSENSIYALLRSMLSHELCAAVAVASRGLAKNEAFFAGHQKDQLWATYIDTHFAYSSEGDAFTRKLEQVDISDFELVFLRLPRPLSDDFLTWLADALPTTAMINHPRGILQTSNKAFLLNFADVCPPMRLVYSVAEIMDFAEQYPIVLKPLREYGGKGILKVAYGQVDDGTALHPAEDYLATQVPNLAADGMLAMQFLRNVGQGDKRIIVVDGEIMAASLRLPAADSWLCNVAQGGTSVATEVSSEERQLIARINPALRKKGILIYGADTLVGNNGLRVLSEVNTLSIGGFPQAQAQSGRPIIVETMDKIFHYVEEYYTR